MREVPSASSDPSSWYPSCLVLATALAPPPPLELELIQSHMAQKPVLRGEVGCACVAREVSVERGGMGELFKLILEAT